MERWIKLHAVMLHHGGIGRLSDSAFRAWITMLLMASHHPDTGRVGTVDDVAWTMRRKPEDVQLCLDEIDGRVTMDERGVLYVRDWDEWQGVSSANAERQRRWRDRHRAARGGGGDDGDDAPPATEDQEPDRNGRNAAGATRNGRNAEAVTRNGRNTEGVTRNDRGVTRNARNVTRYGARDGAERPATDLHEAPDDVTARADANPEDGVVAPSGGSGGKRNVTRNARNVEEKRGEERELTTLAIGDDGADAGSDSASPGRAARGTARLTTEQQELFGAICSWMGVQPAALSGGTKANIGTLARAYAKAGETAETVRADAALWFRYGFPGRDGQPPTVRQATDWRARCRSDNPPGGRRHSGAAGETWTLAPEWDPYAPPEEA